MTDEDREELDLRMPGFGASFKGRSQLLMAVLLMLLVGLLLGLYLYQHEAAAQTRSASTQKIAEENKQAIQGLIDVVKEQEESLVTIIYVPLISCEP